MMKTMFKKTLTRLVASVLVCFMLISTLASCLFVVPYTETEASTEAETTAPTSQTTDSEKNTTEPSTEPSDGDGQNSPAPPAKYTVSFLDHMGEIITTYEEVVEGSTVTPPTDPYFISNNSKRWFSN